jgi:hypothetical protein
VGVDVFHLKRRKLDTVAAQRRDFADGERCTHIGSASNLEQKEQRRGATVAIGMFQGSGRARRMQSF